MLTLAGSHMLKVAKEDHKAHVHTQAQREGLLATTYCYNKIKQWRADYVTCNTCESNIKVVL